MSGRVLLSRVTVARYLYADDVVDEVLAETAEGTDLPLAEALGMLALAQHTLVESYSAKDGEDDE